MNAQLQVESRNDIDLRNIPENISDQEMKSLINDYPDLVKAGGTLLRGTPWKGEAANDDTLRVYYSYEQQDINENKLVELVKEAHEAEPLDVVVTLPSGGVSLGTKIARSIDRPLHYVHATAYGPDGKKGKLKFSEAEIDAICEGLPDGARILLADDLSDSGQALEIIKKAFKKRRKVVVTATTYKKEGSSHTPDICPFPHHPKLWIVQPSEYREGPVTGHNVTGIKDHPVTQCIEEVVERVSVILDKSLGQQNAYKTLKFYVPKDAFDPRVSMAVAKILKDTYKIRVRFISDVINSKTSSIDERIEGKYGAYMLKTSRVSDKTLGISLESGDTLLENEDEHNRKLVEGMRVHVVNRPNVHFVILQRQPVQNNRAERLRSTLLSMHPNTSCSIGSYPAGQNIESENDNSIKIYL